MLKSLFENELMSNMQKELRKHASDDKQPNLTEAAECLHSALEIFEQHGMRARADQVLKLLEKIAQSHEVREVNQFPNFKGLMEAGLTQRDMAEFTKGNLRAIAKMNLVLRRLGLSDHQMVEFIGPTRVMSEEEARETLNPNKPGSLFESKAGSKKKSKDRATKGLTPKKEVKNLLNHGHPLNVTLADDGSMRIAPSIDKDTLSVDDLDPDFVDILNAATFDIDASDDELMGMEIAEDSLEVFENDVPMEDFEDERD